MKSPVKLQNKTAFLSGDLRKLCEAALEKCNSTAEFRAYFETAPRARSLKVRVGRRWIAFEIPAKYQKAGVNLIAFKGELGDWLYWNLYWAIWKDYPPSGQSDREWAKSCALRLKKKAERETRPAAIVREERARKRLASLEKQLVALEKKKKSLQNSLKKARARVKYYDKRTSKAAQNADWEKRLKSKVAELPPVDGE